MIAYAMVVAPDWSTADLSLMLEYHEFVVSKALEQNQGRRPQLRRIIQADYDTRGRWQLFLREFPDKSLPDAIRHHQANSSYIWSGIHSAVSNSQAGRQEREETQTRGRSRSRSPAGQGRGSSDKSSKIDGRRPHSFLENQTTAGDAICPFFNKGKCNRGAQCQNLHICDYPKCFAKHARHQKHVVRPPQRR